LNYSQKAHNESGEKIAWKSPPREQSMSNDTQAAFQPLLDILYGSEGTHLLYAARVAHTARIKRPINAANRPLQARPQQSQPKQNQQHRLKN
jgi:hypothetical protein